MDKNFLMEAFHKMGEYPININLIFDKYKRRPVGYAFIEFHDPTSVIQKLDGLIIPDSNPVSYIIINLYFLLIFNSFYYITYFYIKILSINVLYYYIVR